MPTPHDTDKPPVPADSPIAVANGGASLGASQASDSPDASGEQTEPEQTEGCIDLPTYISLIGQKTDIEVSEPCGDREGDQDCGDQTDQTCGDITPPLSYTLEDADDVDPESELERDVEPHDSPKTGLRYINVRPSEEDPYKGEAVHVIQSGHIHADVLEGVTSESEDPQRIHTSWVEDHRAKIDSYLPENDQPERVDLQDRDTIESCLESHTEEIKDDEGDSEIDTLPTQSSCISMSQAPTTIQPTTPPLYPDRRRAEDRLQLGGSKVMKRSSSVISDSGIESEPSSVAWSSEARVGRSGGEAALLLQQAGVRGGRRAGHPGSLEGLQTESHGSLPSGTQASLTSISSLPYEEDDARRMLSTLTKSASAPHISSPDDTEEDPEALEVEGDNEEREEEGMSEVTSGIEPDEGSESTQRRGSCTLSTEPIRSSLWDQLDGDVLDDTHLTWSANPIQADEDDSKDATTEPGGAGESHGQIDLEAVSMLSTVPEELMFQHFMSGQGTVEEAEVVTGECLEDSSMSDAEVELCGCESEACEHKVVLDVSAHSESVRDPSSLPRSSEEDKKFPEQHSNSFQKGAHGLLPTADETELGSDLKEVTPDGVTELVSNERRRCSDLIELSGTTSRDAQQTDGGQTSKSSSSGLSFVNKKVVEVVNMSVSCAPTCLPFSSVLRDSPSISGISARQATSPITHQPLGSFTIISSTSASESTDEGSNERML